MQTARSSRPSNQLAQAAQQADLTPELRAANREGAILNRERAVAAREENVSRREQAVTTRESAVTIREHAVATPQATNRTLAPTLGTDLPATPRNGGPGGPGWPFNNHRPIHQGRTRLGNGRARRQPLISNNDHGATICCPGYSLRSAVEVKTEPNESNIDQDVEVEPEPMEAPPKKRKRGGAGAAYEGRSLRVKKEETADENGGEAKIKQEDDDS